MKEFNEEHEKYQRAKKRVKKIRGFYTHLFIYIVVNVIVILLDSNRRYVVDGNLQFWAFANIFFWGIGLFVHWASVFGPKLFLTKKWEERKIEELMKKDSFEKKKWE